MEAIERRAAWVAITLAVVLAFSVNGLLGFAGAQLGDGELAVYLASIFALAAAAALLVLAVAPDFMRTFTLEQRARFVFFAFLLVAVAIVTAVGLHAHFAIDAARHPEG